MLTRVQVLDALNDLIERSDGITFQRLARQLLRRQHAHLVPHAERSDLGRDSTILAFGRERAVLASLTASWAKIRRDLSRVGETSTDLRAAIFVTPRSVTLKDAKRWQDRALESFSIDLLILERTWVVDECLRDENRGTVFRELRIPPDLRPATLATGMVASISLDHHDLESVTAACDGSTGWLVYAIPERDSPDPVQEQVYAHALDLEEERATRIALGHGANPDCDVHGRELLVTWIRCTEPEVWSVFVGSLRRGSQVPEITRVCEARNLRWRPMICRTGDVPAIAIVSQTESKLSLRLRSIDVGASLGQAVDVSNASSVATSADRTLVAVQRDSDDDMYLDLYRASAHGLRHSGSVQPSTRSFTRYDVLALGSRVVCAFELVDRIEIVTVTNDGVLLDRKVVAPIGFYPALCAVGSSVCLAWIGGPPNPLKTAGLAGSAAQRQAASALWLDELDAIEADALEIVELRAEDGTASELDLTRLREWKSVATVHAPEPFSAMWLALVDSAGSVIDVKGRVAFGSRRNRDVVIAAQGGRGIVGWISGARDSDPLLARGFQVQAVG